MLSSSDNLLQDNHIPFPKSVDFEINAQNMLNFDLGYSSNVYIHSQHFCMKQAEKFPDLYTLTFILLKEIFNHVKRLEH